jgi:hypothetical protein
LFIAIKDAAAMASLMTFSSTLPCASTKTARANSPLRVAMAEASAAPHVCADVNVVD